MRAYLLWLPPSNLSAHLLSKVSKTRDRLQLHFPFIFTKQRLDSLVRSNNTVNWYNILQKMEIWSNLFVSNQINDKKQAAFDFFSIKNHRKRNRIVVSDSHQYDE